MVVPASDAENPAFAPSAQGQKSWSDLPDVVIAGVLKPATDTRNFHKLGKTIASYFGLKVVCLGAGENEHIESGVRAIPIYSGSRLGWQRLVAWYSIFMYCLRSQPRVVIITTAELIPVAWLLKRLRPALKLVYDVQENYTANVQFGSHYPKRLKPLLLWAIRTAEHWMAENAAQWWWAEKCYEAEMSYIPQATFLIQNLSLNTAVSPQRPVFLSSLPELKLLIYGTLGQDYGTLEGIDWFRSFRQKMVEHYPSIEVRLTVAGYAADGAYAGQVLSLLNQLMSEGYAVHYEGINKLVPHEHLIRLVSEASVVLMPYQVNEALKNRIPTKLYDALAMNKVVWMSPNPVWKSIYEPLQAGREVNFSGTPDYSTVSDLVKQEYYADANVATSSTHDWHWQSQVSTLWGALKALGLQATGSQTSVNAG